MSTKNRSCVSGSDTYLGIENPSLVLNTCGCCTYFLGRVLEGSLHDGMLNVSAIRVWSVPSITVTMSLHDVEVTIDNELVTVEESTDNTDIYLREGIRQNSRQAEAMHELVGYFKETVGFDEKFKSLINLLMIAPIDSLPVILDKHDIPLPEGFHDDSDADSSEETHNLGDTETQAEEDETSSDGPAGSRDSSGDDVSVREGSPRTSAGALFTPSERGTNSEAKRRDRSSGTHPAARGDDPIPLRELVPPHQLRSKSIIRSASEFRLSDAEAASPIQRHAESRAIPLHFSLPIRTRTAGIGANESESSSALGVSATRVFPRLSYPTSRGESSGQTHSLRVEDASEISSRGIGFLGELFVTNPVLGNHRSRG